MLREDQVEESIQKLLKELVCPREEVIDWLCSTVRSKYNNTIIEQQKIIDSIEMQINRINRMEEQLYDDKLAGEITRDKYEAKKTVFTEERTSLEDKKASIVINAETTIEKRIVVLRLSQKAAEIYSKRTSDQKRLIISKLFSNLSISSGSLSVNYTNFTEAIAQRAEKSRQIIGVQK